MPSPSKPNIAPTRRVLAIVLAGGKGERLHPLTHVLAQAELRERGDVVGELQGAGQGGFIRGQIIGETYGMGLVGADFASGQDHVHRARGSDEARQAHRAAVDQRYAEAAAEDTEARGRRGDTQVAPEGEFQSSGHGISIDGRDDGFGQLQARRAHWGEVAAGMRGIAMAGGDGFQVCARTEIAARAGEDGDGGAVVGIEGLEGGMEGEGGVMVNRVAGLRAVDRDEADGALGGGEDKISHVELPLQEPPPSRACGAIHLPRFAGEDEGASACDPVLPCEAGEVARRAGGGTATVRVPSLPHPVRRGSSRTSGAGRSVHG